MLSIVTSKGQVTIPKNIRTILNIKPNDRLDFIVEGDRAILVPVKTLKDLRGTVQAKEGSTIDEERKLAKQAVAKRVAEEEG